MKKLLLLLIALSIVFSLCACQPPVHPIIDTPPEATDPATPVELSQINGVALSEFAIVYAEDGTDYAKRAAMYVREEILARTGLELPLIDDLEEVRAHEIVVGECDREISERVALTGHKSEFAILADGESVALEANYFLIAAAAYFFVETYVPTDDFSATIPTEVCLHEPIVKPAKNYILLIGDGMGDYQTRLFEQMANTADYGDGENIFYGDYLPYYTMARTQSLSGTTDSAAAGTALATGYKTVNGYVGQDKNHKQVVSLTELAASFGMNTAVMSTEPSTGATPASFSAHANDRSDADDILADQAALQESRGTVIKCDYNVYTKSGVAKLEQAVVETLDQIDDGENGFFLMYEEAHIDKHCHQQDATNAFLAMVRFNQVIARFMEYAYYHPETCVIITADHETGDLRPNEKGKYVFNSNDHSSALVPVFAYGYGMEVFVTGVIENVQIPKTIAAMIGVPHFGDRESGYPSLLE